MGPVRMCFGLAVAAAALSAQGLITIAGRAGIRGYDGDEKPATAALLAFSNLQNVCDPNRFEQASHISVDSRGNIYFADSDNQRIRRIDPAGTITTVAGSGEAPQTNARCEPTGAVNDGGSATAARLFNPADVVARPDGSLLIADQQNNRIRQVSTAGVISTIGGSGLHNFYAPGIPATSSPMDWPSSLALDSSGTVYFAELHSNRVGKLGADGRFSTVAGTGFPGYNGDRIAANTANLSKPAGIAIDTAGNLLIADTGNHRVRRVGADGVISTVAGTGRADFCGDGAAAAQACLNTPMDVKADAQGNIFIADTGNNRVRRIDSAGIMTTVASDLNAPCAIAVDGKGDLYIVDWQNFVIRKFSFRATPSIAAGGIVNAASFAAPAAPGAIFSIFGTNLAPASVAAETVPWPRSLAGVSVEVNGIPIPLNAVTPGQINAQLPYETGPGTASVVVITADGRSAPVTFDVAAAAPGIFTYGGTVRAIAANQDFSLNAPENPEARGRALVFYVTGLGVVKPAAATGGPASADPLSNAVATIAATVGGVSAEVRFAGLTPGFVGLGQVNVIVPDGAPTGDAVPVTIQGSKAATVSIRP